MTEGETAGQVRPTKAIGTVKTDMKSSILNGQSTTTLRPRIKKTNG